MTVAELRSKIEAILSVADVITGFIPGEVDDRVVDYIRAISESDSLLQLLIDDFFPANGPFGAAEINVTAADGTVKAIDPATLALIMQLITTLGPVVMEWIKRRRQ